MLIYIAKLLPERKTNDHNEYMLTFKPPEEMTYLLLLLFHNCTKCQF